MARVSISKAAKLAGVSRSTLYATYISKGVLTVSSDDRGRKFVDTSELLRVFGSLKGESSPDKPDSPDTVQNEVPRTPPDAVQNQAETLALELKLVREQLEESRQQVQAFTGREDWYQSQIKTLTDTVKLLEDKREPTPPTRRWWQFMWK